MGIKEWREKSNYSSYTDEDILSKICDHPYWTLDLWSMDAQRILKIEEIDESKLVIDKAEELEKMIKFETNKQLNQFSRIFFDKSKINYKIDEK